MAITKRRFQAAQAVVQIDDSFNPPDWYPDEHPPMPEIVARFFELAPDAQGLFRGDMERQYLKLMNMIAAIVGTLDKREMFKSIIGHSGRQHAQFGAKPMHFAAFGDALIWGLEQQFGAAFTPGMKEAWIKLYDDVQHEMMRAGLPGKEGRLEAPNPVGR